MYVRRWILYALLGSWLVVSSAAVEPAIADPAQMVMTNWTERDGLPSNSVLAALQDHIGYIWIASPDGLVRFDGMTFSIWSKSNSDEFSSLSARALAQTPDGTLWIGTNADGLYAWVNGSFNHFSLDSGLPDLSVSALALDAKGRLWIGTAKGICLFDGVRFHRVPTGPEFAIPAFFLFQPDGSMLVASSLSGLWRVRETGIEPAFTTLSKKDNANLAESVFLAAYNDPTGGLWLGTNDGRVLRVENNKLSVAYAPPSLRGLAIRTFFADHEGTLWIGTDNGIVLYRDGEFQTYKQSDGLADNRVSFIFEDREENIWVGSDGAGISKYSHGKFTNYTRHNGLSSNAVNTVCIDKYGSLWIGTDNGLSFLPSAKDSYSSDTRRRNAVDAVVSAFATVRLRQIRRDSQDHLWFSSYFFKGLAIFDGKKLSYLSQKDGLPINRIRMTLEDAEGGVWIATTAGLVQKTTSVKIFGIKDGLPSINIQDVFQDSGGSIWVATDGNGVARLVGDHFVSYGIADGLASDVVFRIFEDSAKRLWFAGSEGLSLWHNGAMHPVNPKMGLAADSVFQIVEVSPGRLWLLCSRGVVMVDGKALADLALGTQHSPPEQRILDEYDGLAGALTEGLRAYQDNAGVMYLPTSGGLSVYDPTKNAKRSHPPPVVIESLEVDGQRISPIGLTYAVPPGTRRVGINFTALSLVAPQKLHFRYKLQGYESNWVEAGNQRSISYTNLSPGNYRFQVQAWNTDGLIDEKGASIGLQQVAFFWQTVWWDILIALILLMIGFFANTIRMRIVVAHKRELENLVTARTLALEHERNRSDGLLLDILPVRAVQELEETGSVAPALHQDVSVLAADLVDFSRVSRGLSPSQIIDELNSIFAGFDEILRDQGCERIKTSGDSYLAMCGVGADNAQHANIICSVAIAMMQLLQRRHQPGLPVWKLRIGIASGSLVAGVVGVKKFAYDIFGEAVSLAWLLQRNSVPQGITLSPTTAALVRNTFTLIARPAMQFKGKPELRPFFLQYNDSKKTEFTNDAGGALVRLKQMLDAKDYPAALALLHLLDFSTMEPDLGYAIWKLGGKCAYLANKPELAISAWQNALQYGVLDKTLEQNLAVLRQR